MKIKDLINHLSKLDPEAVVEIYSPDAETYLPITSVVHIFDTGETQLQAEEAPKVRTTIWNERGVVLHRCDSEEEAEKLIEERDYEMLSRTYSSDGVCNIAVMDIY